MPLRDLKLPAPFLRSPFWFLTFAIWFGTLWLLSSAPLAGPSTPWIPHGDKILHFGYYFGGAGLLSAALYLRQGEKPAWDTLHLLVIVLVTSTGVLDEWHQSWYPFRSGNDSGDLAADFFGAVAGTLAFRRMRGVFDPRVR